MQFQWTIFLIGFVSVFLAGATYGLAGFGFALVAVPLLLIVLPPTTVVPIVLLLGSFTGLVLLYESRKAVDWKRIAPLMLAGIVGMPFGTYFLTTLDTEILKIAIGLVITLSALAMLLGLRRALRNERLASVPVGLLSGVLNGGTGMSGPPVILFFSNQGIDKIRFRANLVAYFLVLNLATAIAFLVGGLITPVVLINAVSFLPALVLGSIVGIRLAHLVDEILFRKLTLIIVILAGLVSVASGMGIW